MPTLRVSESPVRLVLPIGQVLTVTAPAGSSAYVVEPETMVPALTIASQSQKVGPYGVTKNITLTCTAGAISYEVSEAPSATVTATDSGALIGAAAANAKLAKPRILFIGDSIPDYGSAYQTMSMTTTAFPFGGAAFSIASLSWANGSGTSGTLNFNKSAQTLTWTAPGDSAGQPVDVSRAGVYVIQSGTVGKTITVICRPRAYSSATEGNFTVSTTAQTEVSRRSGKSFPYWAHAKAGAAFDVVTLANGGSQIRDVTESASWQIQAGVYDAIVCLLGTNDTASDRTAVQIIGDYSELLPVLKTKAPRVFMLTMLPRSTGMTAGRRQIMAAANRWILSLYEYGVTPVNAFTYLADPASATAGQITGALEDGLHPAVPGAELVGEAVYNALADTFRFDSCTIASSQADTYDATNNPKGNRLPAGGTFNGTGGTAGTGVSGVIAANWSVTRDSGADILAVGSQVARTDGLPGTMQRLAITNPGATAQTILIAPANGTRPTVAAGQVWRTQGAVVASSLSGVQSITLSIEPAAMSGAFIASWGQNNVAGSVMSGTKRKMVMEPFPLEIPAGATIINIAARVTLAAGGAATLDLLPGEWALWRES